VNQQLFTLFVLSFSQELVIICHSASPLGASLIMFLVSTPLEKLPLQPISTVIGNMVFIFSNIKMRTIWYRLQVSFSVHLSYGIAASMEFN